MMERKVGREKKCTLTNDGIEGAEHLLRLHYYDFEQKPVALVTVLVNYVEGQ